MVGRKKRGASRRARAMRFRFDFAGEEHRAISTNVSATGAFLKSSQVPPAGTVVTLREVSRGPSERAIRVRGEVVWCHARPTLDEPETGFGMQLVAAWSPVGDEQHLAEFLRAMAPLADTELMTKERDGHRVTVYRFATPEELGANIEDEEAENTEFEGIDMERALDRYETDFETGPRSVTATDPGYTQGGVSSSAASPASVDEEAAAPPRDRGGRPALLVRPRSQVHRTGPVPPAPEDVTGPEVVSSSGETAQDRQRSQTSASFGRRDPGRLSNPPEAAPGTKPGQPIARTQTRARVDTRPGVAPRTQHRLRVDTPAVEGGGDPRPTQPEPEKKRTWTGLFDTIMSIGRESGLGGLAGPPTSGERPGGLPILNEEVIPGIERADVIITWKDQRAGGRVEKISETMLSVVTPAPGPEYYERVQIVPTHPDDADAEFVMFGTVTRIKDAASAGERLLGIRFTTVDERGQAGVFQTYLQAFMRGP
ncbi:MAG: PilZ domain-containing protein [Myxococcota bacterium]